VACLLISGDAEIRAKVAAQVAAAAKIIPKAPARLHHRCLLVKSRFDLSQVFSERIFMPAPDFQFARFSHPHFLRFTARRLRSIHDLRTAFLTLSPRRMAGNWCGKLGRLAKSSLVGGETPDSIKDAENVLVEWQIGTLCDVGIEDLD